EMIDLRKLERLAVAAHALDTAVVERRIEPEPATIRVCAKMAKRPRVEARGAICNHTARERCGPRDRLVHLLELHGIGLGLGCGHEHGLLASEVAGRLDDVDSDVHERSAP